MTSEAKESRNANRRTVRVAFVDYPGRVKNLLIYRILSRFYDVQVDFVRPDYVIDGGLGTDHFHFPDAVRIVIVGESYVPDFNQFDYAIGFDDITFGDRYLRMPLFSRYSGTFGRLCTLPPLEGGGIALARREFCSFVVSNEDGDPLRIEFFKRLSKYRRVASGGGILNNMGGRVADKIDFISRYKFNIAFENSTVPGYTTEKVMEPLSVRSIPIYYGNPRIEEDFDPACMVRVASREDVERAVEEIIRLDRDDAAYLEKLAAPTFRHPIDWYEARLTDFLRHIFDQPLDQAHRLNAYGYQTNIRRRAKRANDFYFWTHPHKWVKRLKSLLG